MQKLTVEIESEKKENYVYRLRIEELEEEIQSLQADKEHDKEKLAQFEQQLNEY